MSYGNIFTMLSSQIAHDAPALEFLIRSVLACLFYAIKHVLSQPYSRYAHRRRHPLE